jgi:hypothetical protein
MDSAARRIENLSKELPMQVQTAPATKLQYSSIQDKEFQEEWRVEALDMRSGDVFVAVFSGPLAKDRANEYADFKNRN